MIKFKKSNNIAVYSNYMSINGYREFYIIDTYHGLISPIMRTGQASIHISDSNEKRVMKNFKDLRRAYRGDSRLYEIIDKREFDKIRFDQSRKRLI